MTQTAEKLNALFNQMCTQLNEHSLNYCANIEIFSALGVAGEKANSIVSKALGNQVVLGNTTNINANDILNEVAESLDYTEGTSGSVHPNSAFLESQSFLLLKQEILEQLQNLLQQASQIMGFWIKEGEHPFYPVWWDYAFIIEQGDNAYVLIGSASD
jgi:hypothetical protein